MKSVRGGPSACNGYCEIFVRSSLTLAALPGSWPRTLANRSAAFRLSRRGPAVVDVYSTCCYNIFMTKTARRTTFYPAPIVAKALVSARNKKISERINELLIKGLAREEEEKMQADYERYATALSSAAPRKKDKKGVTAAMAMSAGLFSPEDEPEGWF